MFTLKKTITSDEIEEIASQYAPSAFVYVRRPVYALVDESELLEFLFKSRTEVNQWRQSAEGLEEMVCVSFADLQMALLDQERIKDRCRYRLAEANTIWIGDGGLGHNNVSFFNLDRELKVIENNETVLPWAYYQKRFTANILLF